MKTKYWNWIYFIGLIIPVVVFYGQFVSVALSDGSAPLIGASGWNAITSGIDTVSGLMPITSLADVICEGSIPSAVLPWCYGVDFVLWLSIMHLVLDVFMIITSSLSKMFDKFGASD